MTPIARNPALISNNLIGLGLSPVQDFEKTFARKLDSTQYIFNRQLGFVSLNITLQPDEVLGCCLPVYAKRKSLPGG